MLTDFLIAWGSLNVCVALILARLAARQRELMRRAPRNIRPGMNLTPGGRRLDAQAGSHRSQTSARRRTWRTDPRPFR